MDISNYLIAFIAGSLFCFLIQLATMDYGIGAGDIVVYKYFEKTKIGKVVLIEKHNISYKGDTDILLSHAPCATYYYIEATDSDSNNNTIKLYEHEVLHKVGVRDKDICS